MLRRLWANLGTLLLALSLAFAVWISAVVAADPSEVRDYPDPLPLEVRGQDPSLVLIGNLPDDILLRLSAPLSLWDRLTSDTDTIQVYVDLTGLEAGEHTLPIQVESDLRPFRVIQVTPSEVTVELDPLAVREFPITPVLEGTPALGFQIEDVSLDPDVATVSGPANVMEQAVQVVATLNVSGARETINSLVTLEAVDRDGNVLSGLSIEPETVAMEQSILQAGGYRDVAVKVETTGQPASGFRVTSISVNPPIVTLFSTDTDIVANLAGFVSTVPLDLTGAEVNLVTNLTLNLPAGVIVVGEQQNVEVIIGIAPIETSILLNVQVEVIGLADGLQTQLSPLTVSVVLSGPLSTLQSLVGDDVRLFVDLTGLQAGTHLIEPQAEILPEDVQLFSIVPGSIEVVISRETSP